MNQETEYKESNVITDFLNKHFGKFSAILIVVLGILIYCNSIPNPFIWDDFELVTRNQSIQGWKNFPEIFKGNVVVESSFYRPIQMLSYMVDHAIWGLNPKGFHIGSIAAHIATALALFWFLLTLTRNNWLSLLTSLFFLIHPIHNEAVAYISGRADPLTAAFMLVCLTSYIRLTREKHIGYSVLCFSSLVLALLSKEYALILPGLILTYHIAYSRRINWKIFTPVVIISGLYFLLRMFNVLGVADMHSRMTTTLAQRLPGTFEAIFQYLKLLIIPHNLYLGYGQKFFYWNQPTVLIGLVFYISLIVAAYLLRKKSALLSFSLMWFLIALLPVMNFYPVNAYMAEHWLYVPSIGFFLIVAHCILLLVKQERFKNAAIGWTFILIAVLSLMTVRQNSYWHEPIDFYKRMVKINPRFIKAYNNIGKILAEQDNCQEAIRYFHEALKVEPKFVKGYNNLAVCLARVGDDAGALQYYQKAIAIDPQFVATYNNLGVYFMDKDEYVQAKNYFFEALKIDGTVAQTHYNLGVLAERQNKSDEAVAHYKTALKYDPFNPSVRNNLASSLSKGGDFEDALDFMKESVETDPENAVALNNIGVLHVKKGEIDKGIEYFAKAIGVDRNYVEAHYNIAAAFGTKKSFGQAYRHYRDAIGIDPNHQGVLNNISIILSNQGRHDEAQKYLAHAVQLLPEDVSNRNNLGLVLMRQKKFKEAQYQFEEALKINPDYKEAYTNLALVYENQGKADKAKINYEKALNLDPDFPQALNGLGIYHGKIKDYKKAEEFFLKALAVDPDNHDALSNLNRARGFMQQEGI